MAANEEEERLLRSVALQNANSILLARQRAEESLAQAQESLRKSEERWRAAFNQAAVGMALAGLDGKFERANNRFLEILGYSTEELCTRTFLELTHPDDVPQTQVNVRRLLAGEVLDYSLEKRYLRKGGAIVWSLTTVTLLKDATGKPQTFIGVIDDITERKRTEDALRETADRLQVALSERESLLTAERAARSEAERVSVMKDEFLATLSHELRTPLNAIVGWSQLLAFGKTDAADLQKGLEAIQRNARAQAQLIEDLLDMSRIISGKVRLDVQWADLATVVDTAVDSLRPSADAKDIRLRKILDPHAGPVSGDPARLQQIVWNLLSNAIKFTPKGGKVDVVLQRVNSHLELTFHDSGIGIKPEFLPFVFERFRQADSSSTRSYGGLGLGLSIVKNLVELHGGTVSVESAGDGLGATFIVGLPLAPVRGNEKREHPATRNASNLDDTKLNLAGVKVLIVDDEPDARILIGRVLTYCQADVLMAASATEGLDQLRTYRPDVLVSDIGMPGMDGYQFIRNVRSLSAEQGGKTPAIALTAFARSEDRTRAMIAGYQVHISKPIEPQELAATVGSLAGRMGTLKI